MTALLALLLTGQVEVRLYLSDSDRKPLELDPFSAELVVSSVGPVSFARAKGRRGHGTELRKLEGIGFAELEIASPCSCCTGEADVPYFRAELPVEVHQCGVPGHAPLDRPGTCATCGTQTLPRLHLFTARASVLFQGRRLDAGPVEHPVPPRGFEEGLARLEGLLEGAKTHLDAARIAQLADRLPRHATGDDLPVALKACLEIVGLAKELEDAARAGRTDDFAAVLARIRARTATLRSLVRAVVPDSHGHSHP